MPPENRRPRRGPHPNRQSQHRREKTTVLIVCEGRETERNYFEELKREDVVSEGFFVRTVPGRGGSRQQIVQRAVDLKNRPDADFDEVWCVMDTERLDNEETRQDYRRALRIAHDEDVKMVLSNPAFEVWLLAHFLRTSRSFRDCSSVIIELNRRWKIAFHQDYDKSDQQIYRRLLSRKADGITNARLVRERDHVGIPDMADSNSATEVYKLVEHLFGASSQS